MDEKKIRYIMLSQMKGIGPVTQNALLNICGNIDKCFDAGYEELILADKAAGTGIGKKRIELFISQREDPLLKCRSEQIMKDSDLAGIDIITREDALYPGRFRSIPDIPVLLYCKGRLRINDYKSSIGIVGARRCSAEGKDKAIGIAVDAAEDQIAVISGMAKGIDSYAHTAALKSQGYTIAVLGNGADICYPKEHDRLYEEIARQGCILSEYPPGTRPREYNFPQRNRLIAALSDRLFVVDAGRHSGTETTIDNARKYGKEVITCNNSGTAFC